MVTSRGEATRKRLLDAALQVFALQGFEGTRVSDIVKTAGVSQPSFYLYFPSKEAIYNELMGRFFNRGMVAARQDMMDRPNTPMENIVASIEVTFQWLAEEPELTRLMLRDLAPAQSLKQAGEASLRARIEEAVRAGIVRAGVDIDVHVAVATSSMVELTERYLITGLKTTRELAQSLGDIICNGILVTREV